jgi:hypothetical protein
VWSSFVLEHRGVSSGGPATYARVWILRSAEVAGRVASVERGARVAANRFIETDGGPGTHIRPPARYP